MTEKKFRIRGKLANGTKTVLFHTLEELMDYALPRGFVVETIDQFINRTDDAGVEIYENDKVDASWGDDYGSESVVGHVVTYIEEQGGYTPFANSPFDNREYVKVIIVGNVYSW